jgi:quinol monooxygenase YgiN
VILVLVKNPIQPKYADNFPELVEDFTAATRAEPGNLCFDLYRGVDDPNMYVLVEAFEDAAAGETHVNSEHFKQAMALLPTLIADIPQIVNVEVSAGWSRMTEVQGDGD